MTIKTIKNIYLKFNIVEIKGGKCYEYSKRND